MRRCRRRLPCASAHVRKRGSPGCACSSHCVACVFFLRRNDGTYLQLPDRFTPCQPECYRTCAYNFRCGNHEIYHVQDNRNGCRNGNEISLCHKVFPLSICRQHDIQILRHNGISCDSHSYRNFICAEQNKSRSASARRGRKSRNRRRDGHKCYGI